MLTGTLNKRIAQWLRQYFLFIELPLISLAITSILTGPTLFKVITFTLLSLIYFIYGWCHFGKHKGLTFATRLGGMGWSVVILGLLYELTQYPGYREMEMYGGVALIASFLMMVFYWRSYPSKLLGTALLRSAVLLIILGFLLL